MSISRGSRGIDRRTFLGALAVTGLGAYGIPGCTSSPALSSSPPWRDRLGVQLYTLRDRLQQNVPQTLDAVAQIGYVEVETAGYYGLTPTQFRAELDRVGLVSPAGHYGLGALRNDMDATMDGVAAMGQQWVIVPSLDQRARTLEGYHEISQDFNRFGEAARQRGLRFAFHNHDVEFRAFENGQVGYDILLAETDPSLVSMELDLYWAIRAGRDPVALFEQHPGRFPLVHVKDMVTVDGNQRMVDVGSGEIDFARIFAAGPRAGLQHYIVEHDNPDDSLESIRASYAYLQQLTV